MLRENEYEPLAFLLKMCTHEWPSRQQDTAQNRQTHDTHHYRTPDSRTQHRNASAQKPEKKKEAKKKRNKC